MDETIRVTMPMPPNLGNARMHWRAKHRERREYFTQLDWLQDLGQIPDPPFRPMQAVRIAAVMRLGAAMDDDNAMARLKWCLDWLKTRGYIADDRRKNIQWAGMPEQYVKRDGDYHVQFTITPR